MKKILFLVLFFAVSINVYSQTAALTIVNASGGGCDYQAVIHAKCGVFGTGCGTGITAIIIVPDGHTHTWSSPDQLESSTSYCVGSICTSQPVIGWTALPSPYTSVSNYGSGGWGAYPALDWLWTYAVIDYPGCYCGVAGDLGPYCGASTPLYGCSLMATWAETTTYDYDVTINIF